MKSVKLLTAAVSEKLSLRGSYDTNGRPPAGREQSCTLPAEGGQLLMLVVGKTKGPLYKVWQGQLLPALG